MTIPSLEKNRPVDDVRDTALYNKVFGYLVGTAIGDAFCYRTELMHYRDIEAQYGRVTHFDELPPRQASHEPPLERANMFRPDVGAKQAADFDPLGRWGAAPGVYTDDTRYRLMTCQAIVRKRGPIDGGDLANEWFNYRMRAEGIDVRDQPLSWQGPEKVWARMMASLPGLAHMHQAQRPSIDSWDGPLGLIHAGDPPGAGRVGSLMAVAVATAMLPDATIDTVIDNVMRNAGVLGGEQGFFFVPRMRRLLEIAGQCGDVYDLREPFYREFLVTFPPFTLVFNLEMIPCALALCLIAKGDFEQAILGATAMGRDADTIGALVGELMGTLGGINTIPTSWADQVLRLNPEPDLAAMAANLSSVIIEDAHAQTARATAVLSLVH